MSSLLTVDIFQGSCQKKVQSPNRNRVLKKKLGFFALTLNMSHIPKPQ